jgi:hypothetical protein
VEALEVRLVLLVVRAVLVAEVPILELVVEGPTITLLFWVKQVATVAVALGVSVAVEAVKPMLAVMVTVVVQVVRVVQVVQPALAVHLFHTLVAVAAVLFPLVVFKEQ